MIATAAIAAAARRAGAGAGAGGSSGGGGSARATSTAAAAAAAAATHGLTFKALKQGDFLLDLGHLPCFRDGATLLLGAVAAESGGRGGGVLRGADSGTERAALARTVVFG